MTYFLHDHMRFTFLRLVLLQKGCKFEDNCIVKLGHDKQYHFDKLINEPGAALQRACSQCHSPSPFMITKFKTEKQQASQHVFKVNVIFKSVVKCFRYSAINDASFVILQ